MCQKHWKKNVWILSESFRSSGQGKLGKSWKRWNDYIVEYRLISGFCPISPVAFALFNILFDIYSFSHCYSFKFWNLSVHKQSAVCTSKFLLSFVIFSLASTRKNASEFLFFHCAGLTSLRFLVTLAYRRSGELFVGLIQDICKYAVREGKPLNSFFSSWTYGFFTPLLRYILYLCSDTMILRC